MSWDPRILPRQDGRTIVVTGGASGIGYFAAEQLAATGARVIVAARSAERAELALDSIRTHVPNAEVRHTLLDLASLDSVRDAAAQIAAQGVVDVLINNAGIVPAPGRARPAQERTSDGHEVMIGTNLLGHFALTALLWPQLSSDARVVSLGSLAPWTVPLSAARLWSDGRWASTYARYARSKHAVHAFAFELHRRIRAAGDARASLLAHPGYAIDARTPDRPRDRVLPSRSERITAALASYLVQGKDHGAWPVVRAALDPTARSGEFYGPDSILAGRPRLVSAPRSSTRTAFGARLWSEAEERSGIRFEV